MNINDYGQEVWFPNGTVPTLGNYMDIGQEPLKCEHTINVRNKQAHPRGITLSPGTLYNNRQKHRIRREQKTRIRCQICEDQHTQAWTNTQFVKDLIFVQHKEVEVWFKLTLMILCFMVAAILGVLIK